MKKYTAAVIGCGRIGFLWEYDKGRPLPATHIGVFANHPRIQLVGCSDADQKQLRAVKKKHPNIPLFKDTEKLLETTRPDIVVIATPDETHLKVVERVVKYKPKVILCEKPIATTVADGKRILALCKKNRIKLIVNYMRHFDPVLQKLETDIKRGRFGEIKQVRCLYSNGLLNNGSHCLDLVSWYVGRFTSVMGLKNSYPAFAHKNDFHVDGILTLNNDARVALQGTNKHDFYVFEVGFYGTKGAVILRNIGYTIDVIPIRKSYLAAGFNELDIHKVKRTTDEKKTFFKGMADHIVNVLDGKEKQRSDGENAVHVLDTLLALRKSAQQNGKRITIK